MSTAMISVGELRPDVSLLINDSGHYVLRISTGHCIEVDGREMAAALERSLPVADLVTRSATPISDISPRIERSLEHFGCTVTRP
jgi:hypothetical protein